MRHAREKIAIVLTFGALVAGATPGCVSDDSAAPAVDGGSPPLGDSSTPQIDSTAPPSDGNAPLVDGGSPEDTGTPAVDANPPPALLRFAWFVGGVSAQEVEEVVPLAPKQGDGDGGALPAYDVCIAVHGTGVWSGPLLAASAFPAGLQPFDVTAYFPVPAGQYDARIVPAGSTTCNLPDAGAPATSDAGEGGADDASAEDAGAPALSTDFTSLPAVAAGSAMTAVLVDPLNPGTSIADLFTFTDDTTTTSGKAKLRFVNVSENDVQIPNTVDGGEDGGDAGTTAQGGDFGIGGGVAFDPLFTNVTSQAHLDPTATNGYRELDPLSAVDSTMLPTTGQQSYEGPLASDALALSAGAIFTAFYATESVNDGEDGIQRVPVLVWCYDGQASATSAHLTKCGHTDVSSDSVRSYTRVGNFSADGLGRDICVKYHSYGTYVGPLFAQVDGDAGTALPAQSLSGYFNTHGGYAFDVRLVNAGATNCATSVVPDTTFTAFSEPNGGGYTSVLLTGYATVPDDAGTVPPYDAGSAPVFDDDAGDPIDAGPQPTSAGLTTLAARTVVIEDEAWATDDFPAIRVIHLAATHPGPITMSFTGNGVIVVGDDDDDQAPQVRLVRRSLPQLPSNEWDIDNVPYGGFSTRPGPTDPFGYETMENSSLDIVFEANEWTYGLGVDQTSMFAFDGAKSVQLLACDDYEEDDFLDTPIYADCCVVGDEGCGQSSLPQVAFSSARTHRAHARKYLRPRLQTRLRR